MMWLRRIGSERSNLIVTKLDHMIVTETNDIQDKAVNTQVKIEEVVDNANDDD